MTSVKRRQSLRTLFALLLVGVGPAQAQQEGRVPIVALLITHPPVTDQVVEIFRTALRQYGYEDGKNIKLEVRTALGRLDRVPGIAEELVRMNADIIVLANEPALRAVTQATRTIPVVMAGYTDDPAAIGWIESYRRPGGNVTGVFTVNFNLMAKRLELLREALVNVSQIAVLWDPSFGRRQLDEAQGLSTRFGLRLQTIEIRSAGDLAPAFAAAKHAGAGAVLLIWTPVAYVNRGLVASLGLDAKLPIFTDMSTLADAGALLSYGSIDYASWVRAAYYVDRLLQGARAADLPVEQMSNIKLVINLKTAKTLRITVPQSILLRADKVIQ